MVWEKGSSLSSAILFPSNSSLTIYQAQNNLMLRITLIRFSLIERKGPHCWDKTIPRYRNLIVVKCMDFHADSLWLILHGKQKEMFTKDSYLLGEGGREGCYPQMG